MQDRIEEILNATKDGLDAKQQHTTTCISTIEDLLKHGKLLICWYSSEI